LEGAIGAKNIFCKIVENTLLFSKNMLYYLCEQQVSDFGLAIIC